MEGVYLEVAEAVPQVPADPCLGVAADPGASLPPPRALPAFRLATTVSMA